MGRNIILSNITEVQILQAFSVFEQLEGTTSRTEKEDILKANKDNKALLELLNLTYNPFVTFGIKKDPNVTPEGTARVTDSYSTFVSLCAKLSNRLLTGNQAVAEVSKFLSGLNNNHYKWYMRIIQRDLKAGITEKTVNKIIKDLVPVFTCALANTYSDKKRPKRYVGDPKLDGYRCLAFKYPNGTVELRSRNGHLLEGYAGIEKDVADYLPAGFIYDGEITGRKIETAFSSIQKSAFKKVDNKDGVLNIFDVVSIEEFTTENFTATYEQRLDFLNQITDILDGCRSLERVHQSVHLTDSEEDFYTILELHKMYVEVLKYEGTMIKDLDAVYKKDKSNNILKLKDFYDIDLEVTGVYEGAPGTKYVGTTGGLTVNVSSEDIKAQLPWDDKKHAKNLQFIEGGVFEVGVGSGISDPDRHKFWKNPNEIIGKTITVKFQNTTLNKKNEHSLRFPVLVAIRDDK